MLTSFLLSLNSNCESIIRVLSCTVKFFKQQDGVYMFEFLWKQKCTHEKITPAIGSGYCPDCGEYVENHWYITRCECCGIKQKTLTRNGKVYSESKFCRNCGSDSFAIEQLDCIDIVNINYAAVLKKIVANKRQGFIQTWIDQNSYTPMKLLASY